MKKLMAATVIAGALVVGSASGAAAGEPTCADEFGSGWKNHGEHVLGYVRTTGAAGGAPAHLGGDRDEMPAPGASFCLEHAGNPGLHF